MLIQSRHNVPSLYHLCQSALKTCLYTMRDLRNVPFYLIEDILNTLPAEILMKLEAYNDYLIEDTNDIWMRHCLSEFPDVKEQYEDGELEFDTWRDLYMDKLEEKQQNVALAAAKLRNKYKALEKKKESRKIVVTDVVIPDKKKREHFAHTSTSTSTKSVGKSLMRKSKLQARREASRFQRLSKPSASSSSPQLHRLGGTRSIQYTSMPSKSPSSRSESVVSRNQTQVSHRNDRSPMSLSSRPRPSTPPSLSHSRKAELPSQSERVRSRPESSTTKPAATANSFFAEIGVLPSKSSPKRKRELEHDRDRYSPRPSLQSSNHKQSDTLLSHQQKRPRLSPSPQPTNATKNSRSISSSKSGLIPSKRIKEKSDDKVRRPVIKSGVDKKDKAAATGFFSQLMS